MTAKNVAAELENGVDLVGNGAAYAVVRDDGSVVTRGSADDGGHFARAHTLNLANELSDVLGVAQTEVRSCPGLALAASRLCKSPKSGSRVEGIFVCVTAVLV